MNEGGERASEGIEKEGNAAAHLHLSEETQSGMSELRSERHGQAEEERAKGERKQELTSSLSKPLSLDVDAGPRCPPPPSPSASFALYGIAGSTIYCLIPPLSTTLTLFLSASMVDYTTPLFIQSMCVMKRVRERERGGEKERERAKERENQQEERG